MEDSDRLEVQLVGLFVGFGRNRVIPQRPPLRCEIWRLARQAAPVAWSAPSCARWPPA
jgi:hypothetical protein